METLLVLPDKRGCNKRGVVYERKRTQTNARKRRQMQILGSLKWVRKRRQTCPNASKRRQMRTNAKSNAYTPFYAPPFAAAQFRYHPHRNNYKRKYIKIPGFRIFSLLNYESEIERKSLGFYFYSQAWPVVVACACPT